MSVTEMPSYDISEREDQVAEGQTFQLQVQQVTGEGGPATLFTVTADSDASEMMQ